MICDTTFVSDLLIERRSGKLGRANSFIAANRKQKFRLPIITAGEILLMFDDLSSGWRWLEPWTIYRLHSGIVDAAVEIDREQIRKG
jgi:predicted nucleic acid-binding protein